MEDNIGITIVLTEAMIATKGTNIDIDSQAVTTWMDTLIGKKEGPTMKDGEMSKIEDGEKKMHI